MVSASTLPYSKLEATPIDYTAEAMGLVDAIEQIDYIDLAS